MSKKILLVEDNNDARAYMKIVLQLSGFEVLEAVDGVEAVTSARVNLPDLILMDIAMPVMNGLTATRIIRESEKNNLPIIAVTSYTHYYDSFAIEAGCNELIPKPVDTNRLNAVLNKYLPAKGN